MLQTSTAPRWIQRHSYNHVRDKDIIICYRQRQLHCGDGHSYNHVRDKDIVLCYSQRQLHGGDRDIVTITSETMT